MDLKKYINTFQGLKLEAHFTRLVIMGLLVILAFCVFTLAQRPQIVTIRPWTLNEDAQITRQSASKSYLEAWGFALAQLLGNVTPANVKFIGERLAPLLDPGIYHDVMDSLGANAQRLVEQRIAMRFEPRRVIYEQSTGLVFVNGYSFVREGTSFANEKRVERTYEFGIKIDNYAPLIVSINTYEGSARTTDVIDKQRRIDARNKAKQQEQIRNDARWIDPKADTRTTVESDTKLQ